jgi:hypothetical protein
MGPTNKKQKSKIKIAELPPCGNDFLNFAFWYLIFYLNLLHTDCLDGAGVNADPAVDAGIGIDDRLFVNHANGLAGALRYTGFATGAFFLIHLSRHLYNPFKKQPKNLPLGKGMLQNYQDVTTNFRAIITHPHNKGRPCRAADTPYPGCSWGFSSSPLRAFPPLFAP